MTQFATAAVKLHSYPGRPSHLAAGYEQSIDVQHVPLLGGEWT